MCLIIQLLDNIGIVAFNIIYKTEISILLCCINGFLYKILIILSKEIEEKYLLEMSIKQTELEEKYIKEILVGILTGVFISFICVVLICKVANADSQILYSILPKSITTPMGISLTNILGGIESITVVCIILTGILGYIMGEAILKIGGIKHSISKGIALGTAAHAVGTSKALELGEVEGAMGSLSIGIAGCLTVILIPILSNFI